MFCRAHAHAHRGPSAMAVVIDGEQIRPMRRPRLALRPRLRRAAARDKRGCSSGRIASTIRAADLLAPPGRCTRCPESLSPAATTRAVPPQPSKAPCAPAPPPPSPSTRSVTTLLQPRFGSSAAPPTERTGGKLRVRAFQSPRSRERSVAPIVCHSPKRDGETAPGRPACKSATGAMVNSVNSSLWTTN